MAFPVGFFRHHAPVALAVAGAAYAASALLTD